MDGMNQPSSRAFYNYFWVSQDSTQIRSAHTCIRVTVGASRESERRAALWAGGLQRETVDTCPAGHTPRNSYVARVKKKWKSKYYTK